MVNSRIRLYAPHPGYIEPRAVAALAGTLKRKGFNVDIKEPPHGVRYSTPWNVLFVHLGQAADVATLAAVASSAIGWARRRWHRRRENQLNRDHLIVITARNGKELRRILIEEGEVRELQSAEEQHEAMIRAAERQHDRILGRVAASKTRSGPSKKPRSQKPRSQKSKR